MENRFIIHLLMSLVFFLTSCQRPEAQRIFDAKHVALTKYGQSEAGKYHLKFILDSDLIDSGLISDVTPYKSTDYHLVFTSTKSTSLQQGRSIALPIVCDFSTMLQHDPAILAYYDYEMGTIKRHFGEPPDLHNMSVRIAFWDHDVNRPKPPYLAQILFYNGVFHYFEADPETQSLRLVYHEPYADAVAKL